MYRIFTTTGHLWIRHIHCVPYSTYIGNAKFRTTHEISVYIYIYIFHLFSHSLRFVPNTRAWAHLNAWITKATGLPITMTSQWERWRRKSPVSQLFAQLLVLAQIKNIKAPRHCPLWGEFTSDRWITRTKGQQRGECFHLMTLSCNDLSQMTSSIWPTALPGWYVWCELARFRF